MSQTLEEILKRVICLGKVQEAIVSQHTRCLKVAGKCLIDRLCKVVICVVKDEL